MEIADRDGKVDLEYGVSIEPDGITRHRTPRLAHANEVVGAYAVGALFASAQAVALTRGIQTACSEEYLPSPRVRRAIGAVINVNAAIIATSTAWTAYDGMRGAATEVVRFGFRTALHL